MGRLTTPGHVIEAGWFLLKEANTRYYQYTCIYTCTLWTSCLYRNDDRLRQIAIKDFIECPWAYGWDNDYGGFFYYLDKAGHCPVQLEWNNKLWWPHCEGLIAALLAYSTTSDPKHWVMFKQCFDYTVTHVSYTSPVSSHINKVHYVFVLSFRTTRMENGMGTWIDVGT